MNEIDRKLRDGYRTRIVTNQNSLREKALIFRCGLDDRVIELGKLFLIAHAGQQHPDAEFSDVFSMRAREITTSSSSENSICRPNFQEAFTIRSPQNYLTDFLKKTYLS